jgi:hypothetical protein
MLRCPQSLVGGDATLTARIQPHRNRGEAVRGFASAIALLFAYSAVIQHNDPDPIRWMALYGTAAIACAISAFRPVPRVVFIGLATLAGLWAATLMPSVVSAAALSGTEEERELGGLLLVVASGVVLARSSNPRSEK